MEKKEEDGPGEPVTAGESRNIIHEVESAIIRRKSTCEGRTIT